MGNEALYVQRAADLTPVARQNRIGVLEQIIGDSERILADLNKEREWHLFRLSQIPAAMDDAQGWKDKAIQELEIINGGVINKPAVGQRLISFKERAIGRVLNLKPIRWIGVHRTA